MVVLLKDKLLFVKRFLIVTLLREDTSTTYMEYRIYTDMIWRFKYKSIHRFAILEPQTQKLYFKCVCDPN